MGFGRKPQGIANLNGNSWHRERLDICCLDPPDLSRIIRRSCWRAVSFQTSGRLFNLLPAVEWLDS